MAKFKVGDRVKCKTGFNRYLECENPGYPGAGYDEGKEFIIDRFDLSMHKPGQQVCFGTNGFGVYSQALELIEEEKPCTQGKMESIHEYDSMFNEIFNSQYKHIDWSGVPIFITGDKNYEFKTNNKKGVVMQAVDFVKRQALKVSNPDEFALREAGLHDECGDLTDQGEALRDSFLEALVHDKMVETAKAIIADKEKK